MVMRTSGLSVRSPKDERREGCPASAGTILDAIGTGSGVLAVAVLAST